MSEGFGKGVVLERITASKKENRESVTLEKELTDEEEETDLEVFFQNFLNELRTIGSRVKSLEKMVLKAKKLIPENKLVDKENAFMSTMMRAAAKPSEPSILSHNKEIYEDPSFLAELQRIKDSIIEEKIMHKEKRS